jgi:hypothetical protein
MKTYLFIDNKGFLEFKEFDSFMKAGMWAQNNMDMSNKPEFFGGKYLPPNQFSVEVNVFNRKLERLFDVISRTNDTIVFNITNYEKSISSV